MELQRKVLKYLSTGETDTFLQEVIEQLKNIPETLPGKFTQNLENHVTKITVTAFSQLSHINSETLCIH